MKCASSDCTEEATTGKHCRDCDIELSLKRMTCPTCGRMRYRTDEPMTASFGKYLWGDPCTCPPVITAIK